MWVWHAYMCSTYKSSYVLFFFGELLFIPVVTFLLLASVNVLQRVRQFYLYSTCWSQRQFQVLYIRHHAWWSVTGANWPNPETFYEITVCMQTEHSMNKDIMFVWLNSTVSQQLPSAPLSYSSIKKYSVYSLQEDRSFASSVLLFFSVMFVFYQISIFFFLSSAVFSHRAPCVFVLPLKCLAWCCCSGQDHHRRICRQWLSQLITMISPSSKPTCSPVWLICVLLGFSAVHTHAKDGKSQTILIYKIFIGILINQ